jgi:hypothetical protein
MASAPLSSKFLPIGFGLFLAPLLDHERHLTQPVQHDRGLLVDDGGRPAEPVRPEPVLLKDALPERGLTRVRGRQRAARQQ